MKPGKDKDIDPAAAEAPEQDDTARTEGQEIPADGEEIQAEDAPREDRLPEPTAEEVLQAERDLFEEKWLRAVAEMENVRKRARREVVDSRRFAQADMLRAFLGVLDNIERAREADRTETDENGQDGFRDGVELVFQQYRDVLKEYGVTVIEALGTEFDPVNHEAVAQLEREGAAPGEVIEIVQQGYMFGDMVLRPARVIIASQG